MGLESRCTARLQRQVSEGVARLETAEILFRGAFRIRIRFAEIVAMRVSKGVLRIETPTGAASFELGSAAERWAAQIRTPKPRIDKLGVKRGHVVSVLGVDDAHFLSEAAARAGEVAHGRVKRGSDLVFLGAATVRDLGRLPRLKEAIQRNGALWVVWRKGTPELKEDHVRAAALEAGLVDVKVVAFSPTHSALKLVIPKAAR